MSEVILQKFMKKILTLISLSFLLFSCAETFAPKVAIVQLKISEDFVQGSEDIPLLVGMEKISGDSVGFDSSSGSIMASSYAVKEDLKIIKGFYIKILPTMGWRFISQSETKLVLKRENEKLEIEFIKQRKVNILKFFISSAL